MPDLPRTSDVDLGPLSLAVPVDPDDRRTIRQPGGTMWQWRGDGQRLLSITVATRTTRIPNQHGVQGILRDYLWDLTPGLVGFSSRPLDVVVPTAEGLAAALATGSVDGLVERHVVACLADGVALAHLVHVVVRDDDEAQDWADAIVRSVRLHPDRATEFVIAHTGPAGPGRS